MDFSSQLSGLLSFGLYFVLSIIFMLLFKIVYAFVTPYDEWKLIKEQKNTAASVAFGGAVVGFALALAGAASNSVSVLDYAIWAVVALLAQLVAFSIVRFFFMPKIVSRIENGEVSAAVVMAATSLAVGMLNAACMSY